MSNTANDGSVGGEFNPIIEALLAHGETRPVVILGYAAKAGGDPDKLRIYSSLEDLSSWHDVDAKAVLHQVTPTDPLSPSTFFLRSNAVTVLQQTVSASDQAKFIGGSLLSRHFNPYEPFGGLPGVILPAGVTMPCPTKTYPTFNCVIQPPTWTLAYILQAITLVGK